MPASVNGTLIRRRSSQSKRMPRAARRTLASIAFIAIACAVASTTLWGVPADSPPAASSPPGLSLQAGPSSFAIADDSPLPRLVVISGNTAESAPSTGLESASKITAVVQSAFGILALSLGGLFAYWKFFMGRTFHPRLEPGISATARNEANQTFLSVVCRLKNVGLASVDLDRANSAIRVLLQTLDLPPEDVEEVDWPEDSNLTVDVFQHHEWIEGGETIEDAHLFVLPYVQNQTCRVELRVVHSRRKLKDRLKEWNRRRTSPNAWSQHTILDRFENEPTPNKQARSKIE